MLVARSGQRLPGPARRTRRRADDRPELSSVGRPRACMLKRQRSALKRSPRGLSSASLLAGKACGIPCRPPASAGCRDRDDSTAPAQARHAVCHLPWRAISRMEGCTMADNRPTPMAPVPRAAAASHRPAPERPGPEPDVPAHPDPADEGDTEGGPPGREHDPPEHARAGFRCRQSAGGGAAGSESSRALQTRRAARSTARSPSTPRL